MANMICNIDPSYKKYILKIKTTGKKKLYEKMTKAVCGTLLGEFFYQKLSRQLRSGGTTRTLMIHVRSTRSSMDTK